MEIDITLIVVFLVGLVFGALSKLVDFLGAEWAKAKTRVPSEWEWLVDDLVESGVRAAEQIYSSHEDAGRQKYQIAFDYVVAALKERGLTVDENQIRVLIEAKVNKLFGEKPQG